MSFFTPAPEPKSRLGYYRLLAPKCGIRVSPLCLGAMNIGNAWKDFMGDMTKETAFQILDTFYENGGNFIDTANNYQDEQSEQWIGEWLAKTGKRDEMVIATKFTTPYRRATNPGGIQTNTCGNTNKSLRVSVEASLKKLQTSYIDILYVHWWDYSTGVEELMQSLNHLVASGKVLYLGVSDTPAWVVSSANQYARCHGLAPFVVYQGKWNIAERDFERDIIPMCKSEGMGFAPWGVLGQGQIKTEAEFKKLEETGEKGRQSFFKKDAEKAHAISKVLEKYAKEKNATIRQIALAYVMHKTPYVFPIIGIRKVEQLKDNIDAISITLTDEEIKALEAESPIDMGFPHNFIGTSTATSWALGLTSKHEFVEEPKSIPGRK